MVGIGPDNTGKFHPKVVQTLQEAGAWLKVNGEAIYGTRPRDGDLWKEGDSVRFTRTKDNRAIYAIALQWPGRQLKLETVPARAGCRITLLGYPKPLAWRSGAKAATVIAIPDELQDQKNRPCGVAYVFKIESPGR
jgi:alpha-L-fucosidase